MSYVVAKLDVKNQELVVSDEIKVASTIINAVKRIGAWEADFFAIWIRDDRPNPGDAERIANSVLPDEIVVFAKGLLLNLSDDHLSQVKVSLRD